MSGLSDEELLRRLNWTEIYTGGGIVNIIISTTCRGTSGGLWGRLVLECDVEGHQCEDASRRCDGQSTNIQRVPSCDQSSPCHFRSPHLHGFRSRETSKDVLLFQASISPAEAARTLSEHLASCIARVTLPKRSVPVPSSLVVVQVNYLRCPVLCCNVLTQHSGHLQTLYAVLANFSAVDPVAYDRQVLPHYCANRPLIFAFAGGYSNLKMAGPCQATYFNL